MKSRYFNVRSIIRQKQDWAVELVVRVEDFSTREAVPPCLTIPVNYTRAIYLDISTICLIL
jgi:hypothetical protein